MSNSRNRLRYRFLAIALSACVLNSTSAGEVEDEALASQDARFLAMIEEDLTRLDSLLSENLHYSHTRASVESKDQFLAYHCPPLLVAQGATGSIEIIRQSAR